MMSSFRIDRRAASAVSVGLLALATVTFASPAGASTQLPSVSTGAAHASLTGVELEGSINPRDEAVTYYFQYGPTLAYGSQTNTASLSAGTSTKVPVRQLVSSLLPGYHYRLVASTAAGPAVDGHDRTYEPKKPTTTLNKTTTKTTKPATLAVIFTTKPPAEGQLVGSSLTIAGTLTGPGAVGRQVVLQASPYPATSVVFTNVAAPQTVSATGRFSFSVAHLSRSTRYRVATVGPQPIYSTVLTALATVRVTLHVRTAPQAGLVRLYGTVSPSVSGAIVFFELQEPTKHSNLPLKTPKNQKAEERAEEKAEQAETPKFATAFSVPVKRATKTLSRFSVVESIRKTGLYRAYVQVPKGPLASGHTGTVLLHAAPKTRGRSKS